MTQQERDEIRALVMSFSTRISDLPEVQSLSDTDYITVVQDDGSKKHSKKATFQALLQLLKIHYPDNNGAKYQGVAHPTDQNVTLPIGTDGFWFAIDAGIYTNYGNITVGNCPKVIRYDVVSHEWSSDDLWGDINGTIGFRLKPGVTPNSLDTFRIPVRPNGSYLINVNSLPAGALGSTVVSEFDYDGNLLKRTELESLPLDFIPQTGTDYIQVTLGYNSSNPIDIEHSEVTMSSSVKVLIEGLYNFIVDVLQGEYEARFDNIESDITSILSRLSAAESAIQQLRTDIEGLRDDIDALSSRIDGIDGQIGELGTGLDSLNTRFQEAIDNIQLTVDGIWARFEDDEGYISELQLTARLFQVRLSDAEGNISTLRQTAEEISAQVENAQGDIALLYIRADEIGTRVTNAEGDISTLTQRADEITAQVQNAQGDIATLQITAAQITSTVQNMQGDMSVLEQTAQQISARVTNVEGDVSELYITADEIGTRVTDAEGNISTLTQTSTALTARLEDAEGDITALEVTATGLSTRITNTEGDISTLQLTASSLESRIENAEGDISTLTQTAEGISARVSNTENDISELNITAGEISARVSDAEDNISALEIRADGIEARVSDNEDNIASLELTAEGLTTRVSDAEGNISTLQQTATSLTSRITNAEGDISTLEQTATSLTSRITDAEGNISTLEQTATSLTSRISTAEGNITQINQDIDSIELSVSTISTNLTNYEALTDAALSNLQDQIDGVIQTWYAEGVPTLNNYPANEWDVDEKPNHIGDLYYDKLTGKAYRFMLDGSQEPPVYVWTLIADEDVAKALALAGEKKRVFVTTPYAPYDAGDLWVKERTVNNTTTREIYKCVTSRAAGDTINLDADWVPADSYGYQVNKANLEVLTNKIVGKVTQITYNQDGTISSQSASLIEQNANEIKLQVANGAIDDALDSGGSINSALLPTGIDITNEKVVITANHFYLKGNNVGSDAALVLVYKDNVPKISVINLDVTGVFQTNEWSTQVTNLNTTAQGYANTAESNANSYADGVGASTLDDAKDYSDDNLQLAKDYADNIETSAINTAEDYFNTIVYGNGGTSEHPTSGSILYTINNLGDEYTTLNNQINVGNNSLVSQINTLSGHLTDMGYLAEALLNGRTVVGGGLILSSLIQLGSNPGGQNWQVWSGINGVYDSSAYGNGIAAWYGGAMLDRHYSGNTDSNRAARSLFRFDGSGYLANQKIRWDYDNNDVKLVIDGYVLTHEVQLGYTDQSDVWHTMAGISGSYDATDAANGYGIAAWYGGEKIDRKKTPSATNGATSLFRFDGSGYLANRQIEWGASGELIIHGQSTENPITIENAVLTQGNLSVTISDLLKLKSWFVEEEYTIPGDSTIHHRLKLVGSTTGLEGLHVEGHILSDNDQIVGAGTPSQGGGGTGVLFSHELQDAGFSSLRNVTGSNGKMLMWSASATGVDGQSGAWTAVDVSAVGVTNIVSDSAKGLAPAFTNTNKATSASGNPYYFLGWTGSVLKWYTLPANAFNDTKYTAASGGGLSLSGTAFSLDSTTTASLALADTAYQKPSTGIPKNHLASDVQASLSAADTAYQLPPSGIPLTALASSVQTSLGLADTAYQKPSGGIPNDHLANSTITINGTPTALGGSFSTASITAGTAGTSSATSGLSIAVPYVTLNKYGIATAYGTHTHTISANNLKGALDTVYHPLGGSTTLTTFKIGGSTITYHPEVQGTSAAYIEIDCAIVSQGDQIVGSGTPGGGGGSGTIPYSTDLLDFIQGLTPTADKMLVWTDTGTNNAGTQGGWTLVDRSSVGVTTLASSSAHGLMSTADKIKLDSIKFGTQASDYIPITIGSTTKNVLTAHQSLAAYATQTWVNQQIDALPEPMVFKGSLGTGGTVTSLPAASSSNEGHTYKVITAGTYQSITAKVGDTFISTGSEWVLIPSGDEPEGTVTSVGLTVPTGLSVSGSPITTSGTFAITFASGYSIPTTANQTAWSNKYAKPSTGIPLTDLASGVQTSLGLADTAYQKPSTGIPATDLASAVQTNITNGATAYGYFSSGILPVSHGGTGKDTLTSGSALIGNGTSAVSLRAITNNTVATAVTASTNLITANTLYYHKGNSNIVTVGTITSGTWHGSTIDNDYITNHTITVGSTVFNLGDTKTSLAGLVNVTMTGTLKVGDAEITWDGTNGYLKINKPLLTTGDQIVGSGTPGGGGGGGSIPFLTDLQDVIAGITPTANKMLIWSASGTNNAGTTGGWTLIDKSSVGVTTNASQSAAGLMSSADKIKLDAIEAQANKYVLPIASASVLGGIKVGSGLSINASTGVLDATYTYTLPLAADGTRGGIQIGYSSSGKNYAVQLSSEKAYVNVPWTDTTYKLTLNGTAKGTTGGTDLGSFYAPAGGGTANQVLIAGGNNTAPSWTNQSNIFAGKATADANGATIHNTYLKLSGGTITGAMVFGTSIPVRTTNIANNPYYGIPFDMNGRTGYMKGLKVYASEGDYFYCADRRSDYTITSNYKSGNPTPGEYGASDVQHLFNLEGSSTFMLYTPDLETTPWVLTILCANQITATDVLDLWFFQHDDGDYGYLNSYKIEVNTTTHDAPTTWDWYTVVDRSGVTDRLNRLAVPVWYNDGVHGTSSTYNYGYIKGVRVTIRKADSTGSWSTNYLPVNAVQLRDRRPSHKPSAGIGAMDMRGGKFYGDVIFDYGSLTTKNVYITGDTYIANNKTINQKDSGGTYRNILYLTAGNNLIFGNGSASAGYNTFIDGKDVYLRYGTSRTIGVSLLSTGAVTIAGATTLSSTLAVAGKSTLTGGAEIPASSTLKIGDATIEWIPNSGNGYLKIDKPLLTTGDQIVGSGTPSGGGGGGSASYLSDLLDLSNTITDKPDGGGYGLVYSTSATDKNGNSGAWIYVAPGTAANISGANTTARLWSGNVIKSAIEAYGYVTTDNKVTQTATTTSSAYELLFSATADNTTRTEGARKTSTLTYNPSTKALLTGGTVDGLTLAPQATGFKISGGTTSRTLTVGANYTLGAACAKGVTDNSFATAVTSSDTNLITARTLYYAGYVKSSGVTSITLTSGTGITVSDSGTAITGTGSRTISLNVSGAKTALGLGTMAYEAKADYVLLATAQTISAKHTFSNGILLNTASSWTSSDRAIAFSADGEDANIRYYYTDSNKGLTFNPNTGELKAAKFTRRGGTSSQFLKADGSVDSNTYLTGNQTITLSGDVSGSGTTSINVSIGSGKVTNAMLAGSIAWSKLSVSASNITSTLGTTAVSRATADADGNTISSTYVKKAGDTMTGDLIIEKTDGGLTIRGERLNSNANGGYIYLAGRYYDNDRNGVKIAAEYPGSVGYDVQDLVIYTSYNRSGNASPVWQEAMRIAASGQTFINGQYTYSLYIDNIASGATSAGIRFRTEGTVVGGIFVNTSNDLYFSAGSSSSGVKILTTSNYDGYALPLAGGTMTGSIKLPNGSYINANSGYSMLGIGSGGETFYCGPGAEITNAFYIRSGNINLTHVKAGTNYTIWDASNSNLSTVDWAANNLTAAGIGTFDRVVLSNTGAVSHIEFTRAGWNYISVPTDGVIAFNTGGSGSANTSMAVTSDGIRAGTKGVHSCGLPTAYWGSIYGKDLYLGGDDYNTAAGSIIFSEKLSDQRNGFKIAPVHAASANRVNLVFYRSNVGSSPYAPSWTTFMTLSYDGKATIAGSLTTSGDQVISSDATLKTNWRELNYTVKDIANAKIGIFDWKDGHGTSAGSVAQDWKKLVPELVHGEEGNMTLAYGQIALLNTVLLARHEDEQDKEIKELKEKIKELEDKVKQLTTN